MHLNPDTLTFSLDMSLLIFHFGSLDDRTLTFSLGKKKITSFIQCNKVTVYVVYDLKRSVVTIQSAIIEPNVLYLKGQ